ncbi:WRKY Transcription Factor [Sarracenia purpurea var. burkii]
MEGERGGLPAANYELHVPFTAPLAIQEMGFVQFEDHNPVLSFLGPSHQQPSHELSQPLTAGAGGGGDATNHQSRNGNAAVMGFSLYGLSCKPAWNSEQVGQMDPKTLNDGNCSENANDASTSW